MRQTLVDISKERGWTVDLIHTKVRACFSQLSSGHEKLAELRLFKPALMEGEIWMVVRGEREQSTVQISGVTITAFDTVRQHKNLIIIQS